MLKVTMITSRKTGLGLVVTIGTLLACDEISSPSSDPVFTSLELSSSSFSMALIPPLGIEYFEVRAMDQFGHTMVGERGSFTLSSSDPSVVTVTDTKLWRAAMTGDDSWISAYVNAVATGEAVISASWTIGGVTKTATALVNVESTEGWSLKLDPAVLTLRTGSTGRVQAAVLDATGNTRFSEAAWLTFTSDPGDVVALHEDEWCWAWPCEGHINVLGVAPGEATINARYSGLFATATVIVVP
jgi:hypothetical protein